MMESVYVISGTERIHAKKVLDAAALTYIAAMFIALMQVLYFALRLLASPAAATSATALA